jgi:hypothetical protein
MFAYSASNSFSARESRVSSYILQYLSSLCYRVMHLISVHTVIISNLLQQQKKKPKKKKIRVFILITNGFSFKLNYNKSLNLVITVAASVKKDLLISVFSRVQNVVAAKHYGINK